MKSSELRLNNIVFYKNQIREVCDISTETVNLKIKLCNRASVLAAIEEIEPVELTNGWFIAFEFETDDILFYKDKLTIGIYKDGYYYTPSGLSGRRGIKIEHVHQLQNLYFALTGEELTLKES